MKLSRISQWTRITAAVLAAVLLLAAMPAALAASLKFPFMTTTNDKVNMRRSANTTSVVLERLDKGAEITVTGQSGSFYKVTYNGRTGYVMKKYVNTDADSITTPTPVPQEVSYGYPYETVTTAKATLLQQNDKNSRVLGTVPKGATVSVYNETRSYVKVTYDGLTGYINKTNVKLKTVIKVTASPTPAPTLAPEEEDGNYSVLQKGSSGSAVKALQAALIELGYLSGAADGNFGSATESAVKSLQVKNSYPATGIADANLQALIYSGKPINSKGTRQAVTQLAPISYPTVRLNDTGDLVITIQQRLMALGYYTGALSGTYDKATQTAVIKFQKRNGLTGDGVCGEATQKALLSSNAVAADTTATPKPTATPKATAVPTAAPTFEVPAYSVRQGSFGNSSKLVQQRLKDLGYYKGKIDGNFGSGSVAALKAFQEKNGLTADGIGGKATYAVLFSWDALSASATATPIPATATPTPEPIATPAPTAITKENVIKVQLGSSGDQVTAIQQRLTELGYYTATVDGVCKADDAAAIRAFQKTNSLKADGIAGYDTQSLMFSDSALKSDGTVAGGTTTYSTLRKGMTGAAVTSLQSRLIELGYLTGNADGIYGTSTAEAVYRFQNANGLYRDSIAGSATQALLFSAAAKKAAVATATPAPTATASSARRGDSGNLVKELQQRLIDLGYLTGKADGKFGVQTYQALLAFQKKNGLKADGIAGKATFAKLTASNVKAADGAATATPAPTPTVDKYASQSYKPTASQVRYANWYTEIKARCRTYPYATVYDFSTGISWQVHMFSLGAHADCEPLTAADTARMERAMGGNTWNPKAVWVVFGDGRVYMASTHSMPHGTQHIRDNNFNGHMCIHFPRTASEVAAIGVYATRHQATIDKGWQTTQNMLK